MNRTHTFRAAALIALPFLLLPAGVWLANTAAESWSIEAAAFHPWQGVRWLLRAAYVGGAFIGWRAGRPIWFYPWLGFAVYEAVAVLLLLAAGSTARLGVTMLDAGPAVVLGQFLFALLVSFSPSIAVSLWRGKKPLQPPLAAYTAFPLAALTLPLILSAAIQKEGMMPSGMLQAGVEGMPPFATLLAAILAAIFAVLYWRPPLALFRGRANSAGMAVLFGGVPLCHFLFLTVLIVYSFGEQLDYIGDLQIFLISVGLGWLILSAPLLLPPLLYLPARLLKSSPERLLRSAVGGHH